jgi:hypothetical protein
LLIEQQNYCNEKNEELNQFSDSQKHQRKCARKPYCKREQHYRYSSDLIATKAMGTHRLSFWLFYSCKPTSFLEQRRTTSQAKSIPTTIHEHLEYWANNRIDKNKSKLKLNLLCF